MTTHHTPETALYWVTNLCEELKQRNIDYKYITFIDVANAIEKVKKNEKPRSSNRLATKRGPTKGNNPG